MIRLRFVSHPGPFNVAVRVVQYGFWCSHVEAVLQDGSRLGSWFLKGGVSIQPPGYDVGDFLKDQFVSVNASPEQEGLFLAFLHGQIGKPYDWQAIISFLRTRNWQEPDSWFCSELIAAALAACGLFPQHMAVGFSHITPRDLLLLVSMRDGVEDA